MTIYLGKTTILILREVKDYQTGSFVDADSHEIKIYDSAGTLVHSSSEPTKVDTGKYKFYFTPDSPGVAGEWYVDWDVTVGSSKDRKRAYFYVVDA